MRIGVSIICVISLILVASSSSASPYDANLGPKIDTYLIAQGSPIEGNGSVFFSSGAQYNVDPRLIVAISGAESSFGTIWAACPASGLNAWSWFYNGNCADSPFSSFAEGIQTVTKFMRRSYFNKGYTTIEAIGSKYCAVGCTAWVPNVTSFYTAQGGDKRDLTFAGVLIDFENFNGPSIFSGITPPVTSGIATFSGGQILNAATNLPIDRSKVYGTASFCPGCERTITIQFSQPISNFSVFVINGNTITIVYTVVDDQGGVRTITLAANFFSGAGTVSLPSSNIHTVVISGASTPGGCCSWDFFIDNVRFAPSGG